MRSSEYAPLYRSTVGFDRLFDMLDSNVRNDWPPYDIEKKSEHEYRITMAVAGFSPEEVELTQHGPELSVTGLKASDQTDRQLLHRGLASRNFKHVFKLSDYVKVSSASLENGLLSIELVREIPEEMKPRKISIAQATQGSATVQTHNPEQISQDTKPQRKVA